MRNVNGITQHKQVLRNDIKLAAKLIHALDEKGDLWSNKFQEEGQSAEVRQLLRFKSTAIKQARRQSYSCGVSDVYSHLLRTPS